MHNSLPILVASATLATITAAAPTERQDSRFSFYNLKTPLASPCDQDTGPDNAIWADTFTSNKFVRVDLATGVLDEYDIPYTLDPSTVPNSLIPSDVQGRIALSCVVRTGADGKVYGATGIRNQLARIDPETKKVEVFNTGNPQNPAGNLQPFNDAWPGPTGMWFTQTTGNLLCHFDYSSTKIDCYNIPTPLSGPLGVFIASDKAVWITEMLANKIGRFDPVAKTWKEYPIPVGGFNPTVMRVETPDGKIWFTGFTTNSLNSIDMKTGKIEIHTSTVSNPLSLPTENTLDSKGNIWFSTLAANQLNYYTPATNKFTAIAQPESVLGNPLGVSVAPRGEIGMHYDKSVNSIFFTNLLTNYIGRYQL